MSESDLWNACDAQSHIQPIHGTLYRLVEGQEQIATRNVVDTLEEQSLLEDLLDTSKPPYKLDDPQLHYLLKSPFRYPPLLWGSRFGRTYEPSLFYGACSAEVTLSESAYYRFVYWYSIDEPAEVKQTFKSQHTMFTVGYTADQGLKLHESPFDQHLKALTDPVNYQISQKLGSDMRSNGIQAFEYASARDKNHGTCVALFGPESFKEPQPANLESWLCDITETHVYFKSVGHSKLLIFPVSDFLINGKFPTPA